MKPSSIAKERVPYVQEEPHGIDVVIRGIQEALRNLEWLEETSYGRAMIMSRTDGENTMTFPVCRTAEGFDDLEMIGLDQFAAYSFMVAKGADESDGYNERDRNTYERELDLIVWMDLNRVADQNVERKKREVLETITQKAKYVEETGYVVGGIEVEEIHDVAEEIFDGFTADLESTQMLYYPRQAFRFVLRATFQTPC